MNMTRAMTGAALSLFLTMGAQAQTSPPQKPTDQTYLLSKSYSTSHQSSDGSSGSSNGRNVIAERVIAVRDGGTELEYDLSPDAEANDRERQWYFPARVFRAADGSIRLLNRDELA